MNYSRVIQWSDADNCYIATVPEFAHVAAHGDTPEEACREVGIALRGVLEVYAEEGWQLPEPRKYPHSKRQDSSVLHLAV